MPRLHMQVWQPVTEWKACKKVLSCCQARVIFCLRSEWKACFTPQARNLSFKTWKAVFTNIRFVPGRQNAKCKRGIRFTNAIINRTKSDEFGMVSV